MPVAHRGLHDLRLPENSLGAFDAAASKGYAIELDVRLTADKKIVVIHDANTKRMTGVDMTVAASSAKDLSMHPLKNTSYKLPLLTDALTTIGGRVPVIIEIKYPAAARAIGPHLLAALATYKGDYAVEAFDPRVLIWLRRHAPHVPRGQNASTLPEYPQFPRWYRRLLCSMPLNWLAKPHFIAFDVRDYPRPSLGFWRGALNIPILLWVVSTDEHLALARLERVNIIFESIQPPNDMTEHR
jgi:glycerophosphoryl diester phosphodiesterase